MEWEKTIERASASVRYQLVPLIKPLCMASGRRQADERPPLPVIKAFIIIFS